MTPVRTRRVAIGGALVLATLFLTATAGAGECRRIVAVGDLHGGVEAFASVLDATGLVDAEGAWLDPDACLVQLGDLVDRAPRSRELLGRVVDLQRNHPDRVFVLLGNHEVMNLTGDLRYVTRAEFGAYAGDESAEEREAGFRAFLQRDDVALLADEAAARALFDQRHPPGWFAHRRAFALDGRFGAWLIERPALLRLGRTLFVHGGVSPDDAAAGADTLDRVLHEELRGFLETRAGLVAAGVIGPLADYTEGFYQAKAFLDLRVRDGQDVDSDELSRAAIRLIGYLEASYVRDSGPLWYREALETPEPVYAPTMRTVLAQLGVGRMVVGHTTQENHRIRVAYQGGLFAIDTGAGPEYGGHASAVEIVDDVVRAIYPGEAPALLADRYSTDAGLEHFLSEATVVEKREIGSGITKPYVLELELDGHHRRAAFKTFHTEKFGLTRLSGGKTEANFSDSYRYEVAAYRLDRMLGLRLVPVAVVRTIDGEQGAVIEWVEGAINEKERRDRDWTPEDPAHLVAQQGLMRLFDALIHNTDRHLANILIRTEDGSLHPIDHSRAFRAEKDLPGAYEQSPASLPRWLLPRLQSLEMESVRREMDGLLSKAQVRAILARRDRLLQKIERDRKSFGDDIVFQGP